MAYYQCLRCMKKFAELPDGTPICPSCHGTLRFAPGYQAVGHRGQPGDALPHQGVQPATAPPLLVASSTSPILRVCFVQLTTQNVAFWKKYARACTQIASARFLHGGDKEKRLWDGWTNAVKGFIDAVELFENRKQGIVHIAYAAYAPVDTAQFADSAIAIEICMTVTSHPQVALTTHMGIFKSPCRGWVPSDAVFDGQGDEYGVKAIARKIRGGMNHASAPRIACDLHAYAAFKCSALATPVKKRYMITAPLASMLNILKDKFNSNAITKEKIRQFKKLCQIRIDGDKIQLPDDCWDTYPWLKILVKIEDEKTPKVAVKFHLLKAAWTGQYNEF
jgi:hypothetical protein